GSCSGVCTARDRCANSMRQAWRVSPTAATRSSNGLLSSAGKTTPLAKMAARYVLKYGAQSLALVSMDSYRIGAQEQIKTLGRIVNVPVTLVDPRQSLI
ncbi:flagellar biosynthesis protein FlhF, partial [Pseudomonas aeruginosa]